MQSPDHESFVVLAIVSVLFITALAYHYWIHKDSQMLEQPADAERFP